MLVAAAIGASAGTASAAEIDAASQIRLTYKVVKRSLAGRVSAATNTWTTEKVCTQDRVVKLVKVAAPGKKNVVKKTQTGKLGRYSFRIRKPGRYQALVMPKAAASSYGDLVSCSAAKSKIVKVRASSR